MVALITCPTRNLAAFSFAPEQLAAEIRKHVPSFEISYQPDYRQAIAESWPRSIDDSAAKNEWKWSPGYDLAQMTNDMIQRLKEKHIAVHSGPFQPNPHIKFAYVLDPNGIRIQLVENIQ